MKNNKGFTMIELLAVITIMGILMAIAVPSVTRYLTKARKTNLDTMLKSTYEAAENYAMENANAFTRGETYNISVFELVDKQYLEPLIDPVSKSSKCFGSNTDYSATESYVSITRTDASGSIVPSFKYTVYVKCPESGEKTKVFE